MKSAFDKIAAGLSEAIAKRPCPKCSDWGLPDPSGQTYERLPCPKCGIGQPK